MTLGFRCPLGDNNNSAGCWQGSLTLTVFVLTIKTVLKRLLLQFIQFRLQYVYFKNKMDNGKNSNVYKLKEFPSKLNKILSNAK